LSDLRISHMLCVRNSKDLPNGEICRIHTQQAVDKEVATNLCSCNECFNKVTCHVQQLCRVHVGLLLNCGIVV